MKIIQVDNQILRELTPLSKWDPARQFSAFESVKEAESRRAKLIRTLQSGYSDALWLAEHLGKCRKGRYCDSAACPVCARRFRRRWAGGIAKLIANDPHSWCSISLVHVDYRYPLGSLHNFQIRKAKDRLRKQIARSALRDFIFVGGFDFLVEACGRGAPAWVPHFYLLSQAKRDEALEVFRDYFPRSALVPKPVMTKRLKKTEVFDPATYTYKQTFDERFPGNDSEGNFKPNHRPINADHWQELAPLLHQWGFTKRVIQRLK